jgi:superfamily II DNA or RNA helicase
MNRPTAAQLAEIPSLTPWLLAGVWRQNFERPPGGLPQIGSIRVSEEDGAPPHGCDIVVEADVAKDMKTRVFLTFAYDRQTRSQTLRMTNRCDCRADSSCGHSFAALESLARIASGEAETKSALAAPKQLDRVSIKTIEWLSILRQLVALHETKPGAAACPASQPDSVAPTTKFLAYCIELRPDVYRLGHDALHLVLRIGNRKPEGILIEAGEAVPAPKKPAKYLSENDIVLCTHLHRRAHAHNVWVSMMRLQGSDWDEIVPLVLATGRLFFGIPSSDPKSATAYLPITAGHPVTVETAWETEENRRIQPVLRLPSATMMPILTEPPYYLDSATGKLGPLTSHLATRVLVAWHEGPIISAAEIEALSREILRISPDRPLALPSVKPVRQLTGQNPVPHLEIAEILVGPFLKRHLGALVTFRYPGMPPVPPLADGAPGTTTCLTDTERIVLDRDRDAETSALAILADHRLVPLASLLPARDLNDKNRHACVLETLDADTAAWLDFLESPHHAALVAAGWEIETHVKTGLAVHDVHDFFPTLETRTTLEIDWFRFDVTAEFDGKRISLIPQIARAIHDDLHLRYPDPATIPETLLLACDKPADGHIRYPARRFLAMLEQVRHLFQGKTSPSGPIQLDRLGAARIADALEIDDSETTASLQALGRNLRDIHGLPATAAPISVKAELRPYQLDGFRWLRFLADHGLHGVLADDMGLGKTLQTLTYLADLHQGKPGKPSLVIAPTSVVPNWAAEAGKFTPHLKIHVHHGSERGERQQKIPKADVVLTSYPLLVRDIDLLTAQHWHAVVLDEAHYIKNPKALAARSACQLRADHRVCLSGTPMENHLGELWSLMRFLMPGFLGTEKSFNTDVRKPIERDKLSATQHSLNRRIGPLILRRTKDQVATELPEKTTLIHRIDLTENQTALYESVRAAMDDRVRHAIAEKGISKSHIIVLSALLKLRQICCHPQLLGTDDARRAGPSAKLDHLTGELLPTLIEEGRRILLFSQFTSMLDLIAVHLKKEKIPFLQLTGKTQDRGALVKKFQSGEVPIFLISLKAGGTGLNLTAADTVIHYDPWWNPAAENQATDRAHRIGQTKPVFVHKLVCAGTIEERILQLQARKAKLVQALLSDETSGLRIDSETLSHLLSPS